jgi:AcrR family transcriptional regulator
VSDPQDHRARRRAETHRRIYTVALQLFRERGWDVPVGQIAAAAGVSVPTFYDHFPSKEHLLFDVPTRADIEQLLQLLPPGLPTPGRVRALLIAFLTNLDDRAREDVLTRWRIVAATPGLRYRAAEFERTTAELVLGVLPQREGEDLTRRRIVVTASLSAYTEILLRWAESDDDRPVAEIAGEVLDALRDL